MIKLNRGGSRVGGPGDQDPPFWGTPKLHKEGRNVVLVHANTSRFSS